jgi:phosphonopyruvate decarboxylase
MNNHQIIVTFDFFVGVPDSGLKDLINEIEVCGKPHIIAVNEAHAMAIAFGAELAGQKSCVYLQNSGLGNIINPLTSLCMPAEICPHLVIGHRHTLEQHQIMGDIDEIMLKLVGYKNYTLIRGSNNAE